MKWIQSCRYLSMYEIRKDTAPTLFIPGIKGNLPPVGTAQYHITVREKVGCDCDLRWYLYAEHRFYYDLKERNSRSDNRTLRDSKYFF